MIYLSCDHGGFELKNKLKNYFIKNNIKFIDEGPQELDPSDDYNSYAVSAAKALLNKDVERVIFACRSGIGPAIAANRFKGIRAASCNNVRFVQRARKHNDLNYLCLAGDFSKFSTVKKIINSFLTTEFLGGRYERRNKLLDDMQ